MFWWTLSRLTYYNEHIKHAQIVTSRGDSALDKEHFHFDSVVMSQKSELLFCSRSDNENRKPEAKNYILEILSMSVLERMMATC